jgi:broad specificity phosphatase PhoE
MTSPTTLSFVRHGLVHNPQGVYYGRLPGFRLSDEGIQQAQRTSELLSKKPLVAVFSSPLLRARQTAKIILARHPHLSLKISQFVHETHTPFEGQPGSVAAARNWDVYTGSPPEYEQPLTILTRTLRFVARARQKYAGQHIVIVTHGDVVLFMVLWAKQLPITIEQKINFHQAGLSDTFPAPASISTFTYQTTLEDEIPQLEYINPSH